MKFKVIEAVKKYPFIEEGNCIILNFISLDSVEDVHLNESLNNYYPLLSEKLYRLIFNDKIQENNIFPFTQTKNNTVVLNIPYKYEFFEDTNEQIINNLSDKINNYLEKQKIKKVFFCKKQIDENIIKKYIKNKITGV